MTEKIKREFGYAYEKNEENPDYIIEFNEYKGLPQCHVPPKGHQDSIELGKIENYASKVQRKTFDRCPIGK